jgi:hypothetical protein
MKFDWLKCFQGSHSPPPCIQVATVDHILDKYINSQDDAIVVQRLEQLSIFYASVISSS